MDQERAEGGILSAAVCLSGQDRRLWARRGLLPPNLTRRVMQALMPKLLMPRQIFIGVRLVARAGLPEAQEAALHRRDNQGFVAP